MGQIRAVERALDPILQFFRQTSALALYPVFQRLSDALAAIRGRFVMSINDVPEIREIFAWARIEEVQTTYTIGSKGAKPAAELIIRGGSG